MKRKEHSQPIFISSSIHAKAQKKAGKIGKTLREIGDEAITLYLASLDNKQPSANLN